MRSGACALGLRLIIRQNINGNFETAKKGEADRRSSGAPAQSGHK